MLAATTSGLSAGIADEQTIASTTGSLFSLKRFLALCPTKIFAPMPRNMSSVGESLTSEPLTLKPRSIKILASALMPTPPIPMK